MRPVIARIWNTETKQWDAISGVFHQWGYGFIETRENVVQYSVAIIEQANGKVVTPEAGEVTFTD